MDSSATSRGGADAMLPGPGDTIVGKYRVDAVIGQGGMGIVMGGVDLSLGRPVAIKFLSPERAGRPGAAERFLREARSAAMIQSEHVVRVYEVSQLPNGAPFIVMEHLRGVDLAQVLIQRGPLSFPEACDLLLQACEALGEAHLRGIVHRDLKPQNLFYTQFPDGSPLVKVLDFGISKMMAEGGQPNLTATDTVMGTPLYMSPEQVRSLKNVDARSDIWALGSILFELVTRSPIFEAPSASALCAMIAMDPPTPLRVRRPDAPPGLEAFVLRCLHKDPAGRFADVAAFAEALAPYASERGRESAMRVGRIVRASGQQLPATTPSAPYAVGGIGMASTVGDRPNAYTQHYPSAEPSGPNPTTQSSWQRVSVPGTLPPPTRSGPGGVLLALLGVAAGLLILGTAGGIYWVASKRHVPPTIAASTTASADAAAPSSLPAPSATIPGPGMTTAPSDAKAPTIAPPPGKAARRDAAADPEAERAATLHKRAEQQCAFNHQMMTLYGQSPAAKKEAAQRAKGFMCRGGASSSCERRTCEEACTILGDDECIRQIDYVINYGPAPKY